MIHEVIEEDEVGGVVGGCNDIIVAEQKDGTFLSTQIVLQTNDYASYIGQEVTIQINDDEIETDVNLVVNRSGKAWFEREEDKFSLTSEEWQEVDLHHGVNAGKFIIEDLDLEFDFNIFLYDQDDKFIITDIDGTITQSDIKGHILPRLGIHAHHEGVVELFDNADENGYNIIYLTARSIAQGVGTKSYLFEVR